MTNRLSIICMKPNNIFTDNPFKNKVYNNRSLAYNALYRYPVKYHNLFYITDYTTSNFEKEYKSYTG